MADSALDGQKTNQGFIRGLGLLDSTMIVAGSMIGSGIFIVSGGISKQVGAPGWLLVVWLVTGLLTLMAALSYGELAAMMPKAAEVDEHHWFVYEIQRTEAKIARDRNGVERAVDAEAGGDFGFPGDRRESKILAAIQRDRADGRPGVDAKKRRFAVNMGADEQMVLARTDQRQCFVLQSAGRGGEGRSCANKSCHGDERRDSSPE